MTKFSLHPAVIPTPDQDIGFFDFIYRTDAKASALRAAQSRSRRRLPILHGTEHVALAGYGPLFCAPEWALLPGAQ
jgi:hypothetical protein